ncbi:S-adenosyl-L-methionine-dependent methyltransferases superfamily protein [Melia azedarach]|uniref:S-adenosyl-L-methionine-dependent methyltransferases superfamily protein n=1 Tax=Melia azedarach TaxID=155640 RepID=A0ACC1YC13_MELAZ|nr:S-adenosyl-L-methionine-dependent methyltransferases superfamily protein [Melia azedarach]
MDLFKERKYPFIFALAILLLTVVVFVLTSTDTTTTSAATVISYFQPRPTTSRNATVSPNTTTTSFANKVNHTKNTSSFTSKTDENITNHNITNNSNINDVDEVSLDLIKWEICKLPFAVDYIPCLDNWEAIKQLKSRRHMEHRERHCPSPSPRCLVPLPYGYKLPVPWPKSRDMIWYDNVPHPKLVEYKKDQNWVRKSGDYFVFPGGGTQFKQGVDHYIELIEKTLPKIKWGKHIRVILDVGCGVASFGGYLLDRDVITMSFAPKDEHEAQIQFALERGIPATLSVIGTQKLTFPDNAYDLIHCARCRVHWDADGGKPLLELNRILRPGGFFIWSATPIYRHDEKHRSVWNAVVNLTESMCWKAVARTVDSNRIGLVIFQKPVSSSCYEKRKENIPPLCDENNSLNTSWYAPLSNCISRLPVDSKGKLQSWPAPWPQRLSSKPPSLSLYAEEAFNKDTAHWFALVSDVYMGGLSINWSSVRNVMDMNASYGGFAAALIDQPLWVMNVIPIDAQDTLSIIFDRGLIGMYHDWCESFNTYPRTYDLLHSSFLFRSLTQRCDVVDIAAEMDRILKPGGYLLIQDTMEMIDKLRSILHSLHWSTNIYQDQFLVGKKGFWRPTGIKT